MIDTKDKLLDAAEKVFSEHGFAGVSLRSIIGEAGVNIAAAHYHFGSKEALLCAVVMRRAGPVNAERLALLDACEKAAGAGPVPVERVLDAFLAPTFHLARGPDGERLMRMIGRLYIEEVLPRVVAPLFDEIVRRFLSAFRRALPDLPPGELHFRLHCAIGAMAQALRGAVFLPPLSNENEVALARERLIAFLAAGLHAPVVALPVKES